MNIKLEVKLKKIKFSSQLWHVKSNIIHKQNGWLQIQEKKKGSRGKKTNYRKRADTPLSTVLA